MKHGAKTHKYNDRIRLICLLFLLVCIDYGLAQTPLTAEDYFARGTEQAESGWLKKAIADFTKSIQLKPECPEAYLACGKAFGGQGNQVLAVVDYPKAIELNSEYYEAYIARGMIYAVQQDRFVLAIAEYNKIIQLKLRDAEACSFRAYLHFLLGEKSLALLDERKSIELRGTILEKCKQMSLRRDGAYLVF